jgi:Family of unknown function (DUF6237)
MNATEDGWDRAEYTCGRCYTTVTATTGREFVRLVAEHRAACHRAAAGGVR